MPDPIIKTGSFLCDGTARHVDVGFVPDIIFAKLGSGATPWLWWTNTSWCYRTQRFAAQDSFYQGIHGVDDSGAFMLGTGSLANVAGETLYWFAIADNGSDLIKETGWIGNGIDGNVMQSGGSTAPSVVMIKRDNSLAGVIRVTGMSRTMTSDGAAALTIGVGAPNPDGSLTLGTAGNVNQLSGDSVGEGHDCISFWERPGLIETVSWVGDNSAGRAIPHTVVDPVAVIVTSSFATGRPVALKLDVMPPNEAAAGNATTSVNTLSGLLTTGSVTTYNISPDTYRAIIFGRSEPAQVIQKPQPSQTAKAVVLRGESSSRIDCGTSNTLSMPGAFSLEWWGSLRAFTVNSASTYATLIARSNGDEGRADSDGLANSLGTRLDGTWSWGILAARPNDLGDWAGPQFIIVTTNYNNIFDFSGSEHDVRTKPWRTGIIVPKGPFHCIITHDGLGRWNLYLNNKLVKQRNLDMTTITRADDAGARVNAGAGVGHRTVIGARQGSSAIGQLARANFVGASVYGSALTKAQVDQLYRRNFLGEALTDITPVERWLADNASGASVPASINAANNGTITQGGVVLRDAWV